ncbi:MAG TPA: restriction endonuclease subunit S [Anaerolineales bacterium]|jgi:type I restriction enzyme S subunit
MTTNWQVCIVADIASPVKNALVGGPFGSNLVSKDYVTTGIPVIRGQNMGERWISGEFVFVSPEKATQLSPNIARPRDLIFTQRGTLGQIAIVPEDTYDTFVVSQSQMKLTVDNEKADTLFIYYVFKSPEQQDYILRNAIQTGVPHTNLEHLRTTQIKLPPLLEQRAIAGILGALDDKIELNRRMNATLESLALAVFKQWFVDNEEVGKWEVGKLGDIAEVIDCLHSKKPDRRETGKPLLQLSNILDNGLLEMSDIYFISEEDYDFWISRLEASPGDCVVTNVGRVGAVAQIPEGVHAALGRNMTAVRCKKEYPYPTFIIQCLLSDPMRQEINNKTDTGTILDALNVKNIPLLQFPMPPHELIQDFENIVRPVRAKMEANLKESRTLASLRDSLLPKLMRGEVRVGRGNS